MKIYVFLAEGFEEIEAVTVIDVLRRAGTDLKTVSISGKREVTGAHNIAVTADMLFDNGALANGDMLVLPGGGPGTSNLFAHEELASLIKDYLEKDRWIAAICAAPTILGRRGLLKGKLATCYPGCEGDLAGALLSTESVVQDGRIITSRGPGTAMDFALMLVEITNGREAAEELASGMVFKG